MFVRMPDSLFSSRNDTVRLREDALRLDDALPYGSKSEIHPLYVNTVIKAIRGAIRPGRLVADTTEPQILTLPYCVEQSRIFAVTYDAIEQEFGKGIRDRAEVSLANRGLPFQYCIVVPSTTISLDFIDGTFLTFAYLLVEGDLGCIALSVDPIHIDRVVSTPIEDRGLIKTITTLIKLPQSTAILTPGQRLAWKATSKNKALPTPYYVVDWKKTRKTPSSAPISVEETIEEYKESDHRFLKYRHDRSAHQRLHVRRIMGVFDSRMCACLVKRGFVIYGPEDILGPVSADHLARRGHPPKQLGETVALRVRLIRQTVVGKPELPYIPAVRAVATPTA